MATPSWHKSFMDRLKSVGWTVERTASNHYKVRDKAGKFLFTFPTTPGDRRSMLNTLGDAKRAGIEALETEAKLLAERDRLLKIELDRATNGAGDINFAASATPIAGKPNDGGGLGLADGVTIMAIAPAMFKSPVMTEPGPLIGGEEILLADNRVLYRCVKPTATALKPDLPGICHRLFPSVMSLKAHIAFHARKTLPVTPNARAKQLREEEATVSTATTTTTSTPDAPTPSAKTKTPQRIETPVLKIISRVTAISDEVDGLIKNLQDLVLELSSVQHDLAKLEVADLETIQKAAKFDALSGSLKTLLG